HPPPTLCQDWHAYSNSAGSHCVGTAQARALVQARQTSVSECPMNPSVKADLIGFLSSLLRLIKDHNKINVNRWRKRLRGEITCKRITSNIELTFRTFTRPDFYDFFEHHSGFTQG